MSSQQANWWIELSELDATSGGEAGFINIARGAADPPQAESVELHLRVH